VEKTNPKPYIGRQVGDGHHEDVIIKAEGATALTVESTSGGDEANLSVRVQNLTLQVQGGR
jgi:hypothetical protein